MNKLCWNEDDFMSGIVPEKRAMWECKPTNPYNDRVNDYVHPSEAAKEFVKNCFGGGRYLHNRVQVCVLDQDTNRVYRYVVTCEWHLRCSAKEAEEE